MTLECGVIRQRGNESDFGLEDEYDESTPDEVQCPQQRNAANARERARMRVLSKAFCRLKTTLPWVPPDTKLSKLDTLRLATGYIAHLRAILKLSENEVPDPTMQPLSMSWPFNFHMHWDNQPSSKPTVIDTSSKNEWSVCAQYLTKKAYHEEDDFRRSKSCHEFDGEKRVNHCRDSRNRRKNNLSPCERTPTAVYGYDGPETSCCKPYKSHAYYNQV